ncbi:XRE family transcriptional regulator [Citricoccus sp. SGAir0253]|uniref:helix-turn-helix transcriptional regulator n=1 Tax=Citricoccus sp. SGAir0253 TaxID=2567881 RepID=UPI0010CD3801|nr:helix-turn-helix transcriptional regulator [Citricoccus sp. SGAir0253]QCU78228.1 XRE family transcriptional regulator [Citricoccus sp. SGAir0253]
MTQHVEHVPSEVPGTPLRALREAAGLTQEDVADRMDISRAQVAAIEGGDLETVRLHLLHRYARALGAALHVEIEHGEDRLPLI